MLLFNRTLQRYVGQMLLLIFGFMIFAPFASALYVYGTDTDADGIGDTEEALYGFDVSLADTDGDGILDGAEDLDDDTLTTAEELYTYGTDPMLLDTDGDGFEDGLELALGSDPLDSANYIDPMGDEDGDGIENSLEILSLGTDWQDADTDDDRRSDLEELDMGTDPLTYEAADMDITDISLDPATGEILYTAANLGNLDVDYTIDLGANYVYVDYVEADGSYGAFHDYQWDAEISSGASSGAFLLGGGSEVLHTGVILSVGSHTVMACAGEAGAHGEIAYGFDNCEIETLLVGPDLVVSSMTIIPDNKFQIVVTNQGGTDLPDDGTVTDLNMYFGTSEDLADAISSTLVLDDYGVGYRTAGGSTTITLPYDESTVPACVTYFLVVPDGTNEVEETDNDNNYYRTSLDFCSGVLTGPDLYATADSISSDLIFKHTLGNAGDTDVDAAAITGDLGVNYLYFDHSTTFFRQMRWYWHASTALLYTQADGSAVRSHPLYYNAALKDLTVGDHDLTICIDGTNAVTEEDEVDNCSTLTFAFDGNLPDLYAADVSIDQSTGLMTYALGNSSPINVVKGAGAYKITLNGAAVLIQTWKTDDDVSYLSAHSSSVQTYTIDPALFVEGPNRLEVCIDSSNVIRAEEDEINNCSAYSFEYSSGGGSSSTTLKVEAGPDFGIGLGFPVILDDEAYASDFTTSPLTSAIIYWGDGSSAVPTQVAADGKIFLQASHTYTSPETYAVQVCADDGRGTVCDIAHISIVGSSTEGGSGGGAGTDAEVDTASEGGSSAGTSDGGSGGSSGGSSSGSDSNDSSDEDAGDEEDQDVDLSSDDEVCEATSFKDIDVNADYYQALLAMWCDGVLHGTTPTTFDPDDVIRRDEAMKVFARLFGYVTEAHEDIEAADSAYYEDVKGEPLAYYIDVMTEEGLAPSVTEDEFNPHDAITFEDIVQTLSAIEEIDPEEVDTSSYDYDDEDSMDRGSFVDFLYSFFQ